MTAELATIIDFIRYGASRFGEADLAFGHGFDNALDESTQLVLHALHLPHDLPPAYGQARLTATEKSRVLALFDAHVRIPLTPAGKPKASRTRASNTSKTPAKRRTPETTVRGRKPGGKS